MTWTHDPNPNPYTTLSLSTGADPSPNTTDTNPNPNSIPLCSAGIAWHALLSVGPHVRTAHYDILLTLTPRLPLCLLGV